MYRAVGTLAAFELETWQGLAQIVTLPTGTSGSWFAPIDPAVRVLWRGRPAIYAAFVFLLPSQQIVGHTDPPLVGTRYHIPIETNPDCWVFHDGIWHQLRRGVIYRMDPAKPHGAVNWGTTTRVHLLIDTEEPDGQER